MTCTTTRPSRCRPRTEPVTGTVTVRFRRDDDRAQPLVLDFRAPADHVLDVRLDGDSVALHRTAGPHRDPARALHGAVAHAVTVQFREHRRGAQSAGGLPVRAVRARPRVHRVAGVRAARPQGALHALARRFPRRGRPWPTARMRRRATAATPLHRAARCVRFAETEPISTYLFSFAAGRMQMETRRARRPHASPCTTARPTRRRWRATATRSSTCTPRRITLARGVHAASRTRSASSTSSPCRAFQFGGMEHPGAIWYRAELALPRSHGLAHAGARPRQPDRARDGAHVVRRPRHHALVQRRVDEGGVRQLHGREDRRPGVPRHQPQAALLPGAPAHGVRRGPHRRREPHPPAAREPARRGLAVRRDHLPEGAGGDAAARDAGGRRRCFATGCAQYLDRYRYGNATWPRPDRHSRFAEPGRPHHLEPRVGGGAGAAAHHGALGRFGGGGHAARRRRARAACAGTSRSCWPLGAATVACASTSVPLPGRRRRSCALPASRAARASSCPAPTVWGTAASCSTHGQPHGAARAVRNASTIRSCAPWPGRRSGRRCSTTHSTAARVPRPGHRPRSPTERDELVAPQVLGLARGAYWQFLAGRTPRDRAGVRGGALARTRRGTHAPAARARTSARSSA